MLFFVLKLLSLFSLTVVAATLVIDINDRNVRQVLREHRYISIVFYAKWCQYCSQMRQDYESAARDLQKKGISLGAVNGPKNRKLLKRFGVNKYPT